MIQAFGICGSTYVQGKAIVIKKMGQPEKMIPIASIAAVQIKPPTSFNHGFILFLLANSSDKKIITWQQANKEANALVFSKKAYQNFLDLKAHIENFSTTTEVVQESSADQIQKFYTLMQQGILTEDEFQQKKRQLLNL